MFLFERLFGITCYLAVLAFAFITIFYRKLKVKDVLLFYIVVLSVFAFFYEPYETADLFRIRNIMKQFSMYDFESFFHSFLKSSTTPVAYLLYWIVGKSGIPGLLPAFTAAVTYSSVFYILYKSAKIYSIGNKSIAIILLFVMSTGNYIMVISNIRTMLAIALLCFCFFRESVLKTFKIWHVLLYFVAALIHNLAIILIIIRFIVFVFLSQLKRKWKIIIISFLAIVSVFVVMFFGWVMDSVFEKAVGYITGDTYFYIWEYIIAIIAIIIENKICVMFRRKQDMRAKETAVYLFVCMIVACVFITQFSIFHRIITYIAPILAIPLLASSGSNLTRSTGKRFVSIFYLSLVMLAIACFRGSLSSLKFFVL